MSDPSWEFATPAFDPEVALQRLRRDLRDMGLTEREGVFGRQGVAIARGVVDGAHIAVAVVRRPSRNSPEWQPRMLKSAAEVRDFTAQLKKKLTEWSDRDD